MGLGRFDREVTLPSAGDITIGGPFNPQDPKVESAKLLFLIVQDDGPNAVTVEGEGSWKKGDASWSGVAKRRGKLPNGNQGSLHAGLARGIALSVVVKPGKLTAGTFDPPQIEALTWCANFMLVGAATARTAASRQARAGAKRAKSNAGGRSARSRPRAPARSGR